MRDPLLDSNSTKSKRFEKRLSILWVMCTQRQELQSDRSRDRKYLCRTKRITSGTECAVGILIWRKVEPE